MGLSVIILAAGQGTRMRSQLPKVLHPLAGKPILQWIVDAAQQLKPTDIYIVYGHGGEQVQAAITGDNLTWVQQKQQLGTGHAVQQVLPHLKNNQQVLVLVGDTPLINPETLKRLLAHTKSGNVGLLTVDLDNPFGLGRIIRNQDGAMIAIVEEKDATPAQKKITEISTGIMAFSSNDLQHWLPQLKNNNAQKEFYLTDVMAMAVADKRQIDTLQPEDEHEVLGVNTRAQLATLERFYQQKNAENLMLQGVTLYDPARLDVRGELTCAEDVTIDVNVIIEGKVNIARNVVIGANTVLKDVTIAEGTVIHPHCHIDGAVIGRECQIGPFARIRPGTALEQHVKVGNFVETKKAKIGDHSKLNHLSYIGDAEIGKEVNVGAGVITCNYDGVNKHKTIIGDGAFIGSDSQLVAPVTVEAGAYIGSGSTITRTAPAGKLTLARAKQTTIDKWQPPKKQPK